MYLGVMLSEHLDLSLTAKVVAQSAGRALRLLIARCKNAGGLPFDVYTKLYNTCVVQVITYGASIWGTKSFSCIHSIHHRAMRFFLDYGKYTPNAAVFGEMSWNPISVEQWKSVCNHWHRCLNFKDFPMNKKLFEWSCR